MSDSYELLLDHDVSISEAPSIAEAIRDVLAAERIIMPESNSQCVFTGLGYPPGPRLTEIYSYGDSELRYWQMLKTIGVKFHTARYVNFYGFPVFEHSACPSCRASFSGDHSVMDAIYECVGSFVNDDRLEYINCPSCSARIRCDRWMTLPDIGFCHLAVEFWNWPSFDAIGWQLSIPDLVNSRTGRKLAWSWGHM